VIECLAAADGAPKWRTPFSASYAGGVHSDTGPRCVPTVHGDRVVLFGAAGDLHCVAVKNGAKLWSRSTRDDFRAPEGYFGAGSAPLVMGDRVLVNVGGRGGAGIVAFSLANGETTWQKTDEDASYSAPTVARIGGKDRAVFVTRYNALAIVPETGEVTFRVSFGKRGPTVNAATPLVFDDLLFVSASYGVGAVAARVNDAQVTELWRRDDVMSSQYVTCARKGNDLYGVDGRQDLGMARLRCFDPRTAKVRWTQDNFGVASLILADDLILALKTEGQLVLFRATPEGYKPLAEEKVFDDIAQALPALSDGRFFARDSKSLKCLAVGTPATP
jgi:outer membrane protein assembly factor BamB